MRQLIIRRPDDMHFHPRSGEMLKTVLRYTSRVFSRGVVMGNLPEPIVDVERAEKYRKEILRADDGFDPIMTIMLTKNTTPEIIKEACKRGIKALKYIPGSTSTNSEEGVAIAELCNYYHILEQAEEQGMIFLGHWESLFDNNGNILPEIKREVAAIGFLDEVVKKFPKLKTVVEHASTKEMIDYVKGAPNNVGATLTVHHASITNDEVCDKNGVVHSPHYYCKPVAKTESDKEAVIKAMISGNPKFFFGSDSAPHTISSKEKENPPAGVFTAPIALPMLCELFEENNALNKLEDFVAKFGAEFYGLPLNKGVIVLEKNVWRVAENVGDVQVFNGGHELKWKVSNGFRVRLT